MIKAMKRNKVYGFLDVQDGKLVNGRGEPILLTGWGLGNWLLPEGYMWLAGGPRMDRPRTIERIVAEVAGEDYAAHFWQEFRQPLCAQGGHRPHGGAWVQLAAHPDQRAAVPGGKAGAALAGRRL